MEEHAASARERGPGRDRLHARGTRDARVAREGLPSCGTMGGPGEFVFQSAERLQTRVGRVVAATNETGARESAAGSAERVRFGEKKRRTPMNPPW